MIPSPRKLRRIALSAFLSSAMFADARGFPSELQKAQKEPQKEKAATANLPEPAQPVWDPLRAEKSIEVGRFYLKKGDYDAAIDRFQDAALYHPGYALPYKFLGEAQERKGLKADAVKSFERYLNLYPHADDAGKVRKHIAKLWRELDNQKKKSHLS